MRRAEGKWIQKAETLYDLTGKKAARAVLDSRIRESENRTADEVPQTYTPPRQPDRNAAEHPDLPNAPQRWADNARPDPSPLESSATQILFCFSY